MSCTAVDLDINVVDLGRYVFETIPWRQRGLRPYYVSLKNVRNDKLILLNVVNDPRMPICSRESDAFRLKLL